MISAVKQCLAGILVVIAVWGSAPASAGITLDAVMLRGAVACGVSTGNPGFSSQSLDGEWSGFDVDFCRAIAAAVLGDPALVQFVPLETRERFAAVRNGEVDVLARNTTWTFERDVPLGVVFAGVTYLDGQGVLVRKGSGITSLEGLAGARVCLVDQTTSVDNLRDRFQAKKLAYTPVILDSLELAFLAFAGSRCDAITFDRTQLYIGRLSMPNPSQAEVLDLVISKEPLGPVVSELDMKWLRIVRWVLFALINAEELGVTSHNVDQMRHSPPSPAVRNFLAPPDEVSEQAGLKPEWTYNIVKMVGNYQELFDRNMGKDTNTKVPRGLNSLWTQGGLLYAPPLR